MRCITGVYGYLALLTYLPDTSALHVYELQVRKAPFLTVRLVSSHSITLAELLAQTGCTEELIEEGSCVKGLLVHEDQSVRHFQVPLGFGVELMDEVNQNSLLFTSAVDSSAKWNASCISADSGERPAACSAT
jgi:hypothetical protein